MMTGRELIDFVADLEPIQDDIEIAGVGMRKKDKSL